jgi:exodeoxyribonuclease VII small subunit
MIDATSPLYYSFAVSRADAREFGEGSMADSVEPDDIIAMSFEDALAELEQIVRRLEAGQVKLDEAIRCYERGARLKRHCEAKLDEAQQRVDRIVVGPDGAITTRPENLD